jgi:hypothetical protein
MYITKSHNVLCMLCDLSCLDCGVLEFYFLIYNLLIVTTIKLYILLFDGRLEQTQNIFQSYRAITKLCLFFFIIRDLLF